jgi:crotonobetainyl-CoA:carnitine CoA-transferase CaiB-like acyl-CoA transferase
MEKPSEREEDQMPLSSVFVIDLTGGISGPFCTMLLGDLGAEVIKVEKPPAGDDFRKATPVIKNHSYYFLLANRNKKSVGLDLKSREGRDILLELIKHADVLVENYRPGTAKALGLDYETIKAQNKRIVYCSISGFGQYGPYMNRSAFDLIVQAMSGLMSVTGEETPAIVGTAIADLTSGLYGAYSVLAALLARQKSGIGQHIDVSMLDSMISMMMSGSAQLLGTGKSPQIGYRSKIIVPFGVFQAKDGKFVLEAASDGTWKKLCEAVRSKDLANDKRFSSIQLRVKNRKILLAKLSKIFRRKKVGEWLRVLTSSGVPSGPIYGLKDVFEDPHVLARNMIVESSHKELGSVRLVGPAVKFSTTPSRVFRAPPLLGEHNEEILLRFGFSESQISNLKAKKIIFQS